jgi:hypothetical protein
MLCLSGRSSGKISVAAVQHGAGGYARGAVSPMIIVDEPADLIDCRRVLAETVVGVRLTVRDGGGELGAVETATEDDFMYFRDSVHAALETGEFGSRFPTFMKNFFASWEADAVADLERELIEIDAAFRKLPPDPPDSNWASKLAYSGARPETLADVYVDKDGAPLLKRLIALAALARKRGLAVDWGS